MSNSWFDSSKLIGSATFNILCNPEAFIMGYLTAKVVRATCYHECRFEFSNKIFETPFRRLDVLKNSPDMVIFFNLIL